MYLVKTDSENRIISVVFRSDKILGEKYIEDFPGSPIDDYKLIDGKVIYDPIPNRPQYDPNELSWQQTMEKENKLLKEQVSALSSQNDFQEELIVELANIVYA